jgi:fucose permease
MTDAAAAAVSRRSALVLNLAFILSGMTTYVAGAMIPDLKSRWGLSYGMLSYLFVVQFVASSLGALLSNRNLRRSVVAGYGLMALGMATFAVGWPTALLSIGLTGFGIGLSIPATNVTITRLYPDRKVGALNRSNLLWGVGAIGCHLLLSQLAANTRVDRACAILASAAVLASLAAARWVVVPAPAGGQGPAARGAFTLPLAFLALQLLVYTGTEASVASFLSAFGAESLPPTSFMPYLASIAFWTAFLGGRALLPLLPVRLEPRLHGVSLAVAGAGVCLMMAAGRSAPGISVGAALLGLGFAPLFALIAAMIVAHTDEGSSRTAAVAFAIGGVGPAVLPVLMGHAAEHLASVRHAFVVPALGIALLVVLLLGYGRAVRKRIA